MRIERFAGTLDGFRKAIIERGQNVARLGMEVVRAAQIAGALPATEIAQPVTTAVSDPRYSSHSGNLFLVLPIHSACISR